MTAQIRWEEPPPKRGRWREDPQADVFAALLANPGRWALLREASSVRNAASFAGQQRQKRPPGFEITARGTKVYARFIGAVQVLEGQAGESGTAAPEAPVVRADLVDAQAPPPEPRAPSKTPTNSDEASQDPELSPEPGPAAQAATSPRATEAGARGEVAGATREGAGGREAPRPHAPTEDERRRIGSRVRAARKARQMTQAQVGAELGIHESVLCMIEGGRGNAGRERLAAVLAWAEAPHARDGLPPREHGKDLPPHAARQVARKQSPMKRHRKPATDWRPAVPAAPIALPKGMELHDCPALKARITERACNLNKARAKGDLVLGDHCPKCPGVVALAKKRPAA